MALKKLDIGTELGRGWNLFKENMGVLIVASLIATLVSAVTCGILGGALTAGMFLIVQRLMRKDPVAPQAGDVFKGFDFFVQALILVVLAIVAACLLAVIPVVGQLAGLAVGAVMMWAMLFLVYQKLSAIDAVKKVFEYTKTGEFTMPLIFALIANVISGLGAIACVVGVFFTIPIAYCMLACGYETLFGGEAEASSPEVNVAPPSEPPADLRL